jgi:hypothetical protein
VSELLEAKETVHDECIRIGPPCPVCGREPTLTVKRTTLTSWCGNREASMLVSETWRAGCPHHAASEGMGSREGALQSWEDRCRRIQEGLAWRMEREAYERSIERLRRKAKKAAAESASRMEKRKEGRKKEAQP